MPWLGCGQRHGIPVRRSTHGAEAGYPRDRGRGPLERGLAVQGGDVQDAGPEDEAGGESIREGFAEVVPAGR
ncbi:hypothetical protein SHO565_59620 [Streptomyces sp. HO565]